MINVAILYPRIPGARFDVAHDVERHMPMSIDLLSSHPGVRGVSVEIAISSAVPDTDAAFIAMCHDRFASIDDFVEAFTAHQDTLQGDMAAYTDIGAGHPVQRDRARRVRTRRTSAPPAPERMAH